MGIPDSSLIDLFEKVRSWINPGGSNVTCSLSGFEMPSNSSEICSQCGSDFNEFCVRYDCECCNKVMCGKCAQSCVSAAENSKSCKFCAESILCQASERKNSRKVHPAASPRHSPEPHFPSFSGGVTDGSMGGEEIQREATPGLSEAKEHQYYAYDVACSSVTSFSGQYSPASVRDDEAESEDSATQFYQSSETCHDLSDIESRSFSVNRVRYISKRLLDSSPPDSPSRIDFTSNRFRHSVQREQDVSPKMQTNGSSGQEAMAVLERPDARTKDSYNTDDCSSELSRSGGQCEQKPLDFENNGLIWFPPPPEDEGDEGDSNFFQYDDDDDDVGESGGMFSSSSNLGSPFPAKEKHNEENREPLRTVVQSHFRALVAQLLQGEGIPAGHGGSCDDWLDAITNLSWQAANFVKPDTSKGGSMDPVDYVKIKCIATGSPSNSTFIKGVVCTKNIKHKRMTSQYKSPKLLLLGGALEYNRVQNQFSSVNTLLQQEIDHLKTIVSKIEAHRPNVLLVEKSVSSYAQEYLLANEISLVLNVKKPLLERIARCTGALITPSVDNISTTRLGHCELFRLERVSEELESANQLNKKPCKTLMFFEGCPRRLGCTVLLKGSCREELKKVKHVVQYAVFAAYHLSLETSFLADEGASLPKVTSKTAIVTPETFPTEDSLSILTTSVVPSGSQEEVDLPAPIEQYESCSAEQRECDSSFDHLSQSESTILPSGFLGNEGPNEPYDFLYENLAFDEGLKLNSLDKNTHLRPSNVLTSDNPPTEIHELLTDEGTQPLDVLEMSKLDGTNENGACSEFFSGTESHQSILVSFSSRCVAKGTVCERSRLLRIKFYGCFDKPLGRYLRDDLFDQTSYCRSCEEPAEAHIQCFTHQQGSLTINVRRLTNIKLPGERDGKIWMWHRCLRCAHIDGIPPATRRVIMSDAAWGLSFGKFLELSFSNHATANRVATCGHSLQRDCLRFYGFGNMVAFFRYNPIDILSVYLPPSILEFSDPVEQEWIRKEAAELMRKTGILYTEISDILDIFEEKSSHSGHASLDCNELFCHVIDLKHLVEKERSDYYDVLQSTCTETSTLVQPALDILDLNRLRRSLLIGSHVWDHRLFSLDSLLRGVRLTSKEIHGESNFKLQTWRSDMSEMSIKDENPGAVCNGNISKAAVIRESLMEVRPDPEEGSTLSTLETRVPNESITSSMHYVQGEDKQSDGDISVSGSCGNDMPSVESNLSDQIDSVWTGMDQLEAQVLQSMKEDGPSAGVSKKNSQIDNLPIRRLMAPMRVYSFDSATRVQERIHRGLHPSSFHLSTLRSFHASGDYRTMVKDLVSNILRTYSQVSPQEIQGLNHILKSAPSVVLSASSIAEGARLLLPQSGRSDRVIAVYDNEPTSIISYALSSKEYEEWIFDKPSSEHEKVLGVNDGNQEDPAVSSLLHWQSFGSLDLEYIHYGSYGSEGASSLGSFFTDSKKSPHLRISFGDESATAGGKVKFSVTCYFAKQFDTLRKKCCPSELDFVRSLSRCSKWSAQGGKSNVYFAKSLDERFIIKQVTKTELDSFEEFAPQYFKYLTDSLSSGSPTCLAKILGIYQVTIKNLRGGKETRMDLMVMENLFFNRNISRVYDLKGSVRSRYNPDTKGANNVLLDTNLLETLRTDPIFLGSKAKRRLERAVWNDTSFLASVDVMDYSLLVGIDSNSKQLVLGIIDFMRQYTWDKHLETWVKASGILGGPKNASPTIISPKQYKRRFRKAMTTYFLTVPDQWSS